MMQFSMYHHYTVDEHLLRAVDVLSRIEQGKRGGGCIPWRSSILPNIERPGPCSTWRVLLHDIAKGRPEDHSVAGAKVARKLCPRFGMTRRSRPKGCGLAGQKNT